MPVDILVGLDLGDEGKGRVVDYLAPNYSCVARFNGGNNAGHTVKFSPENSDRNITLKLHNLPSGIVHPKVFNYIGRGCVVDPLSLAAEIQSVQETLGEVITPDRLGISPYAHVIQDNHIRLDQQANTHIGTTGRGIGPAYTDKVARSGRRLCDLDNLGSLSGFVTSYAESEFEDRLQDDVPILCEGAQGTYLDLDHGDYPYVTSSNTLASHACTTLGFGPGAVRDVIGVFKAYRTKVGEGSLEGEWLDPNTFINIRKVEVGTTTGRQRRIGALHLPMLKKACRLNGVTKLIMTKADLLMGASFPVITDMETKMFQFDSANYATNTGFQAFVDFIQSYTGIEICAVSVGPRRENWNYNNLIPEFMVK